MAEQRDRPTIINIRGDANFQMVDAPESRIGDISAAKWWQVNRQVGPREARFVGYLMLSLAGASLVVQVVRLIQG
ncbi:MAG: hypothetical protein F4Z38_08270 [Chloroflexi bacterium]|nr:hypothetical protein [Chloroflexota bacterium]